MLEEQVIKLKEASIEEKREIVSNFGIYELRALARALGVSSPTTKKRDFLIDAILENIDSQSFDFEKKSNKGRPYKKLESIDNIISLIGETTIKAPEVPKTYSYSEIISFAQELPVFEYQSNECRQKKGVLRLLSKVSYFIDLDENVVVFLANELIEKYNLKNGDFLEVTASKINANNQYSVKDIIKINGYNTDEFLEFIPSQGEKVIPMLRRSICNKTLILGGRNVSIIQDPLYFEGETLEIINSLISDENRVVFLGINLCYEDKLLINHWETVAKFSSDYGKDNCGKNFDIIVDFINHCERLTRLGENVVMVVYDPLSLVNALDLYFSKTDGAKSMGHFQQSNVIIEKLVSLASAHSTGKDCTQIIICNDLDKEDLFVRNQILKISRIIK